MTSSADGKGFFAAFLVFIILREVFTRSAKEPLIDLGLAPLGDVEDGVVCDEEVSDTCDLPEMDSSCGV